MHKGSSQSAISIRLKKMNQHGGLNNFIDTSPPEGAVQSCSCAIHCSVNTLPRGRAPARHRRARPRSLTKMVSQQQQNMPASTRRREESSCPRTNGRATTTRKATRAAAAKPAPRPPPPATFQRRKREGTREREGRRRRHCCSFAPSTTCSCSRSRWPPPPLRPRSLAGSPGPLIAAAAAAADDDNDVGTRAKEIRREKLKRDRKQLRAATRKEGNTANSGGWENSTQFIAEEETVISASFQTPSNDGPLPF